MRSCVFIFYRQCKSIDAVLGLCIVLQGVVFMVHFQWVWMILHCRGFQHREFLQHILVSRIPQLLAVVRLKIFHFFRIQSKAHSMHAISSWESVCVCVYVWVCICVCVCVVNNSFILMNISKFEHLMFLEWIVSHLYQIFVSSVILTFAHISQFMWGHYLDLITWCFLPKQWWWWQWWWWECHNL